MKHFLVTLLVGLFLSPLSFADVSARNGISITTASTINGKTPNSAINGLTITGGASPAWYETPNYASASDSSGWAAGVGLLWTNDALALPAGSVTKLKLKVNSYTGSGDVKIGLYDNGGSLVVSGVASITGNGEHEATVSSTPISSGNYRIATASNSGDGNYQQADFRASGLTGYNTSVGYYTMPSTLPSNDGPVTRTIAVGVYVTP